MVRHVGISQLGRLLLHHLREVGLRVADALDQAWLGEAEAVELEGFWVVGGVGHDGAHGRAEPVADFDVGAIGEGEGLEG